MDDQRNQGRDGPPHQGGQSGPGQQGRQNDRQQQGAQDGPPQQGQQERLLGAVTPERRQHRAQQWLQHLEESPPDPPPVEPLSANEDGQRLANPGRGMGPTPHAYANGAAGRGQPPSFPPPMLHGILPPNHMNAVIPPRVLLPNSRSFGHLYGPDPRLWTNFGAGVPNLPQLGPQGFQPPMPPMAMGIHGNWQGAGAARNQGRVVQAAGNPQPRNSATSNAAYSRATNIQQPAGDQPSRKQPASGGPAGKQPAPKRPATEEPAGEQPSQKRPASGGPAGKQNAAKQPVGEEPAGEQAASKRSAAGRRGEGSAGEGPSGDQPANNSTSAAVPTNPATMSISERLDRDLITDVAGLTRAEEDELLLWVREHRPEMTWKEIHRKFKFKVKEDTLRGRYRKLVARKPLPRKPIFTERDNELLLEAIEHLAGGHLDDADSVKIQKLWTRAQDYIKAHGGKTTAGPSTIKKQYKSIVEKMPKIRDDLKPGKAQWDHKAYSKYKVQSQEEASFDDNVEENEPSGKSGTRGGAPRRKYSDKIIWNHKEYEKYDVEYDEGVDFGEDDDDEKGQNEGETRDGENKDEENAKDENDENEDSAA